MNFFFQAEDGIRDRNVTGVQTCALPISARPGPTTPTPPRWTAGSRWAPRIWTSGPRRSPPTRSEERRVGKECRYRRWRDHYKKRDYNKQEEYVQYYKNNHA